MAEEKFLTEAFEANRRHLYEVAYRMLGSQAQADDAVQEAWLRVARADVNDVDNLRGWLTTTLARICLDMLRTRKSRREVPIDGEVAEIAGSDDVERDAMIAELDWHRDAGRSGEIGASGEDCFCAARYVRRSIR